jgi:FdhD protein
MKKEITIKRHKWGHTVEEKDFAADERNVDLIINNTKKVTISMSPEELKPFAYGYLFTSGLISSKEDVKKLNVRKNTIEVQLARLPVEDERPVEDRLGKSPFDKIITPPFGKLSALYKSFARYTSIFDETGGVHSAAAVVDSSSILFFSEDVGRLNAVDKVIGKALQKDTDLESAQYFLLTSGRISCEVVAKAFIGNLRSIISLSAPTCAAIANAKKFKIGIIGFLRGKTFNIYT